MEEGATSKARKREADRQARPPRAASGATAFAGIARQLWVQVLAGTAVGALVGWAWPAVGAQMKPLGDGFIALLRMMIPPVIFLTVTHGVAGMNDAARVGRVAGKALVWFFGMTLLALVFGLAAVNLWEPGAGMNIDLAGLDPRPVAAYAAEAHERGVAAFLLGVIPKTFASAFTDGQVLQVLLVSLLFAFALGGLGARARPLLELVETLNSVFFRIVGILMWAAPAGAFGAVAFTVARFGVGSLARLGELLLEFYVVCGLFVLVVFGAVCRALGVSLLRLLAYLRDEIVVVAATTSTETVLPRLMQKLRDAGCDESIVGVVTPTGYSFNLDGTCLYLATAAVFLAQATNTPLGLGAQLTLLAMLLITSKGAAAVPGAAFIALAATLQSVGTLPVASIALILGVHRFLAEALTFVNLIGNAIATLVVCRWEKALDATQLQARLGRRIAQARVA